MTEDFVRNTSQLSRTSVDCIKVVQDRSHVSNIKSGVKDADSIQTVVDAIEKEKTYSCKFVHDIGYQGDDLGYLRQAMELSRTSLDTTIHEINKFEEFIQHIKVEICHLRHLIDMESIDHCDVVERFYTQIIDELLAESIHLYDIKDSASHFWIVWQSYFNLLRLKDMIGEQRALGASFLASVNYSEQMFKQIVGKLHVGDYMVKTVRETVDMIDVKFATMYNNNTQLFVDLDAMKQFINEDQPEDHETDAIKSIYWFENMTNYLSLIKVIENDIDAFLKNEVEKIGKSNQMNFIIAVVIVLFVMLICPLTFYLYIIDNQKMMLQIAMFTSAIQRDKLKITGEKQKTDDLLKQLLPPMIASKIIKGEKVEPQFYESVTIYFSEVIGFHVLANKSTPEQMTNFLNKLYQHIDNVIVKYDCYKVETIADQYVIVSGLPVRNTNHSDVIVSMALEVMSCISLFPIPHVPKYRAQVLLTIGCHTGSVAAGVVGLHTPRYCVFGDSVNSAARMESTGYPNRIQISQPCKDHLAEITGGLFETKYRTSIKIKGKGDMDTYWVLGRAGIEFKIEVDETTELCVRK